ncbi:MAG: co-chaperone DjlA [Tahibacter sp.]
MLGKIVGAIAGFLLLRHPLGALLGGVLGHLFDIGAFGGRRSAPARGFLEPLFGLIGAMAKSDGRISEREIAVTEQLMQRMRLSDSQRREAIARFNAGKEPGYAVQPAIADLKAWCAGRRDHAYILIDLLLEVVAAEDQIIESKLVLLRQLSWSLGVEERELMALAAMKGYMWTYSQQGTQRDAPPPRSVSMGPDAYAVLGIHADADERAVKQAWRRLMSEHHPDKLGDVPDVLRQRAEKRARDINAAYEAIKSQRGFR